MLKIINGVLWAFATVFLISMGIYYTYKLKFVQFKFKDMLKNLFKKTSRDSISPFASLMMVLGGRIGVGSVAGIAIAIYYGGVGSIFWMWVVGLITLPLAFVEVVLGVKYKERDGKYFKGGPSYYLKKGVKNKKLGNIYAFLIIFSYVGGFLGIQSNTITKSLNTFVTVEPLVVGLVISLITFIIIIGGVKKISDACSKIVPLMTLLYVVTALYIVLLNINSVPLILLNIFKQAFNFKSLGFGLFGSIVIGIQRGIFSSEAGLGTGAIASSTTDNNPVNQGLVQMLGVYITTFLVCTSTAIIILTANNNLNLIDINGIEITQLAFIKHLGSLGNYIVFISIILFAFSTILSGYYDGEASIKYFNKGKKSLNLLKVISLIVIFFGSFLSSNFLWNLVDILTALLAVINGYAMFILRQEVIEEYTKYHKCDKI